MIRVPSPLTPKRLQMIALLVDCLEQAAEARDKIDSMIEQLGDDRFAKAFEAIRGLDDQCHYITVTMRRVVELDDATRKE